MFIELVANALIPSDLGADRRRPHGQEIFDDRMEITNPGKPLGALHAGSPTWSRNAEPWRCQHDWWAFCEGARRQLDQVIGLGPGWHQLLPCV